MQGRLEWLGFWAQHYPRLLRVLRFKVAWVKCERSSRTATPLHASLWLSGRSRIVCRFCLPLGHN